MSKINRNGGRLFKGMGRLALTVLFAGSLTTLSDVPPVKAGAGDFLGGVGVGVILNEALRGGGGGGSQKKQRSRSNDNNRSGGGSRSSSRYTEKHKTQQALADLGFYTGAIDGTDGANTRAAVSQFQASKQLPLTGVLTSEQRALMIAEADLQKSRIYLGQPNGPALPERDEKRRIQAALQMLGHYTGSIDGVFGGGTSRAVSGYQRDTGYPPTGELSPEQEVALIDAAHEMLSQRLAGINDQFALMSGRSVANLAPPASTGQRTSTPIGKAVAASQSRFPPIEALKANPSPNRRLDVAVVIGNKSYTQGDIPDVAFGLRDAEAVRAMLVNDLGFSPDNIILAEDAGQAEMRAIFGSENNAQGKLWRYIDPDGASNVFVYYSGHGAPDVNSSTAYLLPVDTDPNAIALNGYSLDLMYKNLSQLSVKSVSVMLDACFSGGSHEGMLIKSASPVMVSADMPKAVAGSNLTILAAADGNELASWDEQKGHGMFTAYVLSGMKGEADADSDGKITAGELHNYVRDAVRRQARRDFGREQTPKLMGDPDRVVGIVQ